LTDATWHFEPFACHFERGEKSQLALRVNSARNLDNTERDFSWQQLPLELNFSSRALGRALESDLLAGRGRAASVVIAIYLVVRFAELIARGAIGYAFQLFPAEEHAPA